MKISVAIATYNGAQYLEAQLQSLAAQTLMPDELIVSDDCSSDRTEEIVSLFSKAAPFPVNFSKNASTLGYAANFNVALTKTSGDLVFLCDQDDVWFSAKIQSISDLAEQYPDTLVFMNDAAITDANLNPTGLTKVGQLLASGRGLDKFVMGSCSSFRREFLEFCLPIPPGYLAHDGWLLSIAHEIEASRVDMRVMQYYRRHELNTSNIVANRTTKVSWMTVLLDLIERYFDSQLQQKEISDINQARIYRNGIREIIGSVPARYRPSLIKLLLSCTEKHRILEKRDAVRREIFYRRIFSVVTMMRNGSYARTGGMRAILRDLLG